MRYKYINKHLSSLKLKGRLRQKKPNLEKGLGASVPWLIVLTNGCQLQPLSSPLTQNLFYSFQQMEWFQKKKSNWLFQSRDLNYTLGEGSIISLPPSHFKQRFYPETETSSPAKSVNSFLASFFLPLCYSVVFITQLLRIRKCFQAAQVSLVA